MGRVCENWYLVYFLFSGLEMSMSVAAQMRVVCGVVWLAVAGRLSGAEERDHAEIGDLPTHEYIHN